MNQDKMSQQLSALRARIQELELELQEFKSGRMVVNEDGSVVINDMANEITMLRTENDKLIAICFALFCSSGAVHIFRLRVRVKGLQQVVESQSKRLADLTVEKEAAVFAHQDESTGQGK